MNKKIIVEQNKKGERVDFFLASKFSEYSRNYFAELIKNNNVAIKNKVIKPSYKVIPGDVITITFVEKMSTPELEPEKIKLEIIYENDNVIVINKQPGLVVHPAAGNLSGTLVNALINYFPKIKEAVYQKGNLVSETRPGLVHRLDKDTSGVLIVAKNSQTMHSLTKQIQNRTVDKTYLALCFGWPKNEAGRLVSYLGRHPKNRKFIANIGQERGKEAISEYKVIECFTYDNRKASLIEFRIYTGRTHQIRVHAKELGNPVLGDLFYGNKESMKLSHNLGITRQMLHAKSLKITLPGDNKANTFTAPVPKDIEAIINKTHSL